MADSKITGLTALGAEPADTDVYPIVDVSDTSQAATGTTKKNTVAYLLGTKASQVEAEAGTETAIRRFSPLRIFQAIAKWTKSSGDWHVGASAWSYSAWDSTVRTATITTASDESGSIQLGDRISFSQTTDGVKYGICTKITSSAITVFMYDTQDLDNASITAPRYSHSKNPYGFDANPNKWTVEIKDTVARTQASPVSSTWYNLGTTNSQIVSPIGAWLPFFSVLLYVERGTASGTQHVTLSEANNTQSDADMTAAGFVTIVGSTGLCYAKTLKTITVTSKTTYYLNAMFNSTGATTIQFFNGSSPMTVRLICAYL